MAVTRCVIGVNTKKLDFSVYRNCRLLWLSYMFRPLFGPSLGYCKTMCLWDFTITNETLQLSFNWYSHRS